jgi:hypothetical protein
MEPYLARTRLSPIGLSPMGLAAIATAAVAGLVYRQTMLPGVSVGDWAEMQMIPAQLGVPHPTGYPLYTLLGFVFSLLPVGTVAFRAGLFEVLTAATAVGLAVVICGQLGARPLVAAASAMALAASGTLWQEANFPEMNALHLVLMALVVHRALAWRELRRDRDLLLGALLSGLAISNHLLAATAVPIVVAFVLFDARRRLAERPLLVVQGMGLFLLGLLPYAFIPLRALAGPPEVYGPLATPAGLLALISGESFRQDMRFFSGESLSAAWRAVPDVVAHIQERSAAVFVVAAVAGLLRLVSRDRWPGLLLVTLATVNTYIYVNYVGDLHHYLLLTWLILALGLAVAAEAVVAWLEERTRGRSRGVEAVLLVLPVMIAVSQLPTQDQRRNDDGERLAAEVFDALPPNAVLLTYWDALTTLSYKHCEEDVRPDVTLRAYDVAARVTCDRVTPRIEDEIAGGRPAFALFPLESMLTPLRDHFTLTAGPRFALPYGQRYLDYTGILYRLEPR